MLETLLQFRHRRFRRDLSAYLDNMLSEGARRRLEAHLDSCQACRQELAELRVTAEALSSLPMAEVPRSFALAAAPVAEMRLRPAVRRAELGLRLATATVAFALAVVVIGDFAGLPGGGGEEGVEAPVSTAEDRAGWLEGMSSETPAAKATPTPEPAPSEERLAPEGTLLAEPQVPAETPTRAEATPTPAPTGPQEALTETPAADETPEATPAENLTAVPPGITDTEIEEPAFGVYVEDGEEAVDKAAAPTAVKEDGGPSREDVVRWLEVGLGAGAGLLLVLWALARLRGSIGNRT